VWIDDVPSGTASAAAAAPLATDCLQPWQRGRSKRLGYVVLAKEWGGNRVDCGLWSDDCGRQQSTIDSQPSANLLIDTP
jgi:hypothetical protein